MNETTRIRPGDPRSPGATALLNASHALMQSLFPPEDNFYLEIDELCTPDIHFFVAERGDEILGCCALSVKDHYGEVKSMFVDPVARGAGIAQALLTQVEETARGLGLPFLRLETGALLTEAHRLYARYGFKECGAFGDYPEGNSSLFMEKAL